jgi:hypothetical protein
LGLDADQQVSAELAEELRELLAPRSSTQHVDRFAGFYVKRREIFRGRWIRHGGYYPKYLLKLFRRSQVAFDVRDLVDHHFYVRGNVGKLRRDLVEHNRKEDDVSFWTVKHLRYARLMAEEELRRRGLATQAGPIAANVWGNPDQRVLWFKQLWWRLPLYLRPFLYFVYRYLFRLGFLDGKEGFLFHFLHAWWFRLLVDVELEQLCRKRSGADNERAGIA